MSASISGGDPHQAASKQRKRRIITPARQEQNRAAQRAYRERQRNLRKRGIAHGRPARKLEPRLSSPSSDSSANTLSGTITEGDTPLSTDHLSALVRRTDESPISFADPLMNAIQTPQDTIWTAILNNAVCLGFDLERLAACTGSYMSPFFKSITAQDSPQALVASTFNTSVPIHLQPTMAQILVPHHASLDLIPLPLFRERAIMMAFAMPDIFDLWDLKLDIYERHALVCRRYSAEGTCQPWDQKSWEAMPWFLQKWSGTNAG
ncbi:uncharacterized protein N7515_006934 [Penicillium bovifimosum]|uniref:BZIP domain-containing protein n=1 Tax=Penicillium bovifimosum TaxID=126998 RepID=A0A9W9L1M7_9EURO|nr:uncharacterized protein N7515_006934 [Penicillium bovifimosum]KAJ5130895.1 hypothetical protein N7515_006934 [Penicillium bovifimosum]